MSLYKLKWKMRFRVQQLIGFFKLCRYEFAYKFHLEGDDQFARHLRRQSLWGLVKADPEQEYLEVHGLLPEEDKPEEEPEPEAGSEEEAEPGLIREIHVEDLLLSGLTVGNKYYYPMQVREYEDRTQIDLQIMDDNYEFRDEECVVPHESGARHDAFVCGGESCRWDRVDSKLRHCPVVCEDAAMAARRGPVRVVQGLVLRVDRALAEERLSPLCLEYAYQNSEEGYDWCIGDHSHCPVLYELKMAVTEETERKVISELGFYCLHYWKEAGLGK